MLKTSLLITGDASVARKEVEDLVTSVRTLATGAKATAAPVAELDQAQRGAAGSARELGGASAAVTKVQNGVAAAGEAASAAIAEMSASQLAAAAGARELTQALGAAEAAQAASVAEMRQGAAAQAAVNASMVELSVRAGQLGAMLAAVATASAQSGAASNQNASSQTRAASGASEYAAQLARLKAQLDPAAEAQRRLAQATDLLDTAFQRGDITQEQYALGLKQATAAAHGHAEGSMRMGASGMIAEHVVRSFSDSVAAGQSPVRAMTMEMGRVTEAMTMWAAQSGKTEGAIGRVAGFLGGPWGLAVSVGIAVLTPLIGKLFETEGAADAAKDALKNFAEHQNDIGNFIDKTTGKLIAQNAALIQNATLMRRQGATAADKASLDQGKQGFDAADAALKKNVQTFYNPTTLSFQQTDNSGLKYAIDSANGSVVRLSQNLNALASSDPKFKPLADQVSGFAAQAAFANQNSRKLRGEITELADAQRNGSVATVASVKAQADAAAASDAVSKAQAHLNDVDTQAADIERMAYGPEKIAALAKYKAARIDALNAVESAKEAAKKKRKKKERKPADTTSFTAGVSNDINSLVAQFTDAPTFVEKARAAVARLDKDIAELSKKKPPSFQTLIDQATAAKAVIQANLTKPYDDYIREQSRSYEVLKLQALGLDDQAKALEQINALEQKQGKLSDEAKDGILASVQAVRAEQRELEIRNALNAKYVTEVGSIKSAIEDASQAFVRGDLGQFLKTPSKLIDAFQTLQGQQLFDKLFDGAFRDLQDQANGTSIVKDAAKRFSTAVDDVSARSKATAEAVAAFRSPVQDATSALGGFVAALRSAANNVAGTAASPDLASQLAQGNNVDGSISVPGDIVVTANKLLKPAAAQPDTAKPDYLVSAMQKVAASVTGLFTNHDTAERLGASIGKYAGKGLEGAATGSMVAGIGKTIGINLSSSGSQLGGAVGGILGSIKGVTAALGPLGSAIAPVLSVVGGLVGKLFAPKAQPGGVTVSAVNGSAGVSGTVGSDAAGIKAGNSLGASVSSGVNQIAQQLGGTIGAFAVEIGKYKDDLRVNVNGKALGGVKGSGAVGFGDDETAAVSYAISQAIAQGAVQGLDQAVQRALGSSTDTQKALSEALGVKNLEILLGGVQASLKATFDAEAASAKERLRLAQTYGLDIVATEKANADSLTKLMASTLKQQVGSLQTLITDMTSGSLFEGTAMEKITAINAQIVKAKADLDAGVDGAADTLAKLYQDKLSASKDAYGTTDAYAADRTATLNDAQAAVAKANAQILAAAGQNQSDPALTTTNAALDENNDQNAQIIAALNTANSLLAGTSAGAAKSFNLASLATV
ncbi:hypothetical protein [Sphingomonas sp. CROZ-RG-20F-R02-07]|uniref:hypothetical protein n=1 Tax=Sphingomonas sp. CROZ-RG-20F-R02-07 TaxID=2914832 RepID=UPI001F57A335|nr:hypothetical protein [Sphingomonas sp. CROZ-RG-20F-R02-07]